MDYKSINQERCWKTSKQGGRAARDVPLVFRPIRGTLRGTLGFLLIKQGGRAFGSGRFKPSSWCRMDFVTNTYLGSTENVQNSSLPRGKLSTGMKNHSFSVLHSTRH